MLRGSNRLQVRDVFCKQVTCVVFMNGSLQAWMAENFGLVCC